MRKDNRSFVAVQIVSGRNLAVKDLFSSDPYITFAIVPSGVKIMPKEHHRSAYMTQNTNPVWNFSKLW